jgi:hypothetical protein
LDFIPGRKNPKKNVAKKYYLCKSVYLYIDMGTDMTASALRKQIQELQREAAGLLGLIKQRRPFIRGIVYPLRRKCGKTVCRCQEGHLHESWVLSVPAQGGKRMRTVPRGKRLAWQSLAGRYRRFRRARARLVKLFAAIIKLIDEQERERTVSPPP